jgi:hypothetical protein
MAATLAMSVSDPNGAAVYAAFRCVVVYYRCPSPEDRHDAGASTT